MSQLAYTYAAAASATGISERIIREAVYRGDLIASFPSARPVIIASELERWLASLPHEPVRRAS